MTAKEAVDIMDQVAGAVQSDRAGHAKIQEAINVLMRLAESDTPHVQKKQTD